MRILRTKTQSRHRRAWPLSLLTAVSTYSNSRGESSALSFSLDSFQSRSINYVLSLSLSVSSCCFLLGTSGSASETLRSKSPTTSTSTTATITTTSAAGLLETAQKYYASGDTKRALQIVDLAIRQESSNATAHYLKANCLLKLGQQIDASREYYVAESMAPRSKIAEYSHIARTQINVMQTEQAQKSNSAARISDDDDDEDTENEKPSSTNTASKNNVNDASLPPGTLELIRKQATMAKRMAVVNGAAEAESERQKGIYEARSLQEKAERMAARAGGSNEPVNLSSEERDRVKADAAVTGERLKQIGNWKASIVEQWSHEKSDEIQRQAENLQDQLIDNRSSNVKLNPVGTNLYIRNYAKPPLTPLHAEAKSISTKTSAVLDSKQTNLTLNNNATRNRAGANATQGSHAVSSVKGQVLNK